MCETPESRSEIGRTNRRKRHFSEEQILGLLKRAEARQQVADVCREQGISEGTY
jgi:putative transposase